MVDDAVVVSGASFERVTASPVIVARSDRNFIPALLQGFARRLDPERDPLTRPPASDNNVLKLFQPVHQIHHVALIQLRCDSFAAPRLDPRRIDSCGLVVRRLSADRSVWERWSTHENTIQGWIPCRDDDVDPDPARRRPAVSSGNLEIDKLLPIPAPAYAPFSEHVSPMFIAPPEVCKAAASTVLYGLVPVTSSEKGEAPVQPPYDDDFVRSQLPYFLRPNESRDLTHANLTLSLSDVPSDVQSDPAAGSLASFLTVLWQLKFEFGAFDSPSDLMAALNQLSVKKSNGDFLDNLGHFLQQAFTTLIAPGTGTVLMPAAWPAIDESQTRIFTLLVRRELEKRLSGIVSGEGRFEAPDRMYCLRAFVRVKRSDGCPPALVWSAFSERFTIAAWYDNSGLPPVKIALPNVDAAFLNNLKPNVSFAMPADLFNKLQKDTAKTLKGEDSAGGRSPLDIAWICSFSIPVITICAFIVLNIFLSLFDIFFQWMARVKICVPIPKRSP